MNVYLSYFIHVGFDRGGGRFTRQTNLLAAQPTALILRWSHEPSLFGSSVNYEYSERNAICVIVRGKYAARYAGNWIGCHRAGCGRWLHKKCVSEIDLINMSEEDFENFYFECIYC